MGLYDHINCRYPLPVAGANALDFQTKSINSLMDSYEIREDGTLWRIAYGDDDPVRWQQELLTGEVRFYTGSRDWWLAFSAYFVRGQLKQLEVIEQSGTIPNASAASDS